ncbi:MAG: ATP-binding protein [Acidimicrobiales bacterium]
MRREMGESQTRIIMVVDLVGSTNWRVQHGDIAADRMLTRFEELFADVVASFDGRVVANHGDGFLSSFGSASTGLEAAASFRSELAALPIDDIPPVRIGIAAGDVIERGREMYGLPVVEAARLESVAEPGQILCTTAVRALAGSRASIDFADERRMQLKGLPHEMTVWLVDTTERDRNEVGRAAPIEPTYLPPVDAFVGRAEELRQLDLEVERNPLVSIVGTGGVGKTRLAVELSERVSSRFPDGVFFIDLESSHTVVDVLSAVARTLRLPSGIVESGPHALWRTVGPIDALLVLDNCEQATDAVAEVVHAMLGPHTQVRLVCTSREPLGLRSEVVHRLDPLEAPGREASPDLVRANEAVQLFLSRATGGTGDVTDAELESVAAIVRRVEGLPLAIELAAARMNVLSADGLARRSDDLFRLLAQRDHDRPERHHTMAATLDWSLSLLSDEELHVVVALAVFNGGATLEALEQVSALDGADFLDALGSTIDKSLIRRRDDDRYVMLASVREMILDRSDLLQRAAELRDRHLDHFESTAHAFGSHVQHDPVVLAAFSADHRNLGAALDHASNTSRTRALKLAGHLALYWVLAGRAGEGDRRLTQALTAPGDVPPVVLANALRGAAMAAGLAARYERSNELLVQARAIFLQLGREEQIAYCDHWLSRNLVVQAQMGLIEAERIRPVIDQLEGAIDRFREANDQFGALLSYPYLGWAHMLLGEREAAERRTVELIGFAEAAGIDRLVAYACSHAAFIRFRLGTLERDGIEQLEDALRMLREAGDTQNLVIVLTVATAIHIAADDSAAANSTASELIEAALVCDSTEWEPAVLSITARVVAGMGDWAIAGQVMGLLEHSHPTWRVAMANMGLAPDILEHVGVGTDHRKVTAHTALRLVRAALDQQVGR